MGRVAALHPPALSVCRSSTSGAHRNPARVKISPNVGFDAPPARSLAAHIARNCEQRSKSVERAHQTMFFEIESAMGARRSGRIGTLGHRLR